VPADAQWYTPWLYGNWKSIAADGHDHHAHS
jgi:hypothetical protein